MECIAERVGSQGPTNNVLSFEEWNRRISQRKEAEIRGAEEEKRMSVLLEAFRL